MVNEKGLLLQYFILATRMFFKKMFSGADVRSRTQVRGVASGLERRRDIARMLHDVNMLVAVEGEEVGSEMNYVVL